MPNEKLRATVEELERELNTLETLDPDTRARLQTNVAQLREALADETRAAQHSTSIVDRLAKAVEQFEESHPTLVTMVGRIADGLAQIGI